MIWLKLRNEIFSEKLLLQPQLCKQIPLPWTLSPWTTLTGELSGKKRVQSNVNEFADSVYILLCKVAYIFSSISFSCLIHHTASLCSSSKVRSTITMSYAVIKICEYVPCDVRFTICVNQWAGLVRSQHKDSCKLSESFAQNLLTFKVVLNTGVLSDVFTLNIPSCSWWLWRTR